MKILKCFCAIFLCFIVFAGCSVQNKDSKNKPDESTIAALFDENINCIQNIFVLSSLPHTDEEVEPNVYVVDESYFADYATFEKYICSVYCKKTADMLLYDYPYENEPKYVNIDGKLCVNTVLDGSKGYYVDWTDCKIEIKEADENKCAFSVTGKIEEPSDNPAKEDYTVESTAELENGKWLLTEMIY